MTTTRISLRTTRVLLLAGLALSTAPVHAQNALAAPQGTELWGGPGAKGAGNAGARFDTNVYVNSLSAATGTVDFFAGGVVVDSKPFSVPARGVAVIATPAKLDGAGAFLYRIRSDSSVNAWSETYNETAGGRFGVSAQGLAASDFLNPGDEASGGGADASSDASRSRTNVGLLCNPGSGSGCQMEVAAYEGGALLGSGKIDAVAGAVGQTSLATLVPAASGRSNLSLRLRILNGTAFPYVVRNYNSTSDGSFVPLIVIRNAFSTAPTINSFQVSATSGCAPLSVTATWTTTGATRVTLTGAAGDLPPNGTTTVTVNTSTDLLLTAYSSANESSSQPRRVSITAPTQAPIPSPASANLLIGTSTDGLLPSPGETTFAFKQQESTGSTFKLTQYGYVYTAGSVAGVDVVTLTVNGPCGPATAEFTATVREAGTPQIISFEATPSMACGPIANIVLSWFVIDATRVSVSPADSVGVGSAQATITADTLFTLTAYGVNGKKVQKTLTVTVDNGLPPPILTPQEVFLKPGELVYVDVSGLPNYTNTGFFVIQNQSGGSIQFLSQTRFQYRAGSVPNSTDIIRYLFRNGCGVISTNFVAHVGSAE